MERKEIIMREKIYNFIVNFMTENGYSPSIREIGDAVGLSSTSSVFNHLMNLQDEGLIKMQNRKSRTISLVGYKFVKE